MGLVRNVYRSLLLLRSPNVSAFVERFIRTVGEGAAFPGYFVWRPTYLPWAS